MAVFTNNNIFDSWCIQHFLKDLLLVRPNQIADLNFLRVVDTSFVYCTLFKGGSL